MSRPVTRSMTRAAKQALENQTLENQIKEPNINEKIQAIHDKAATFRAGNTIEFFRTFMMLLAKTVDSRITSEFYAIFMSFIAQRIGVIKENDGISMRLMMRILGKVRPFCVNMLNDLKQFKHDDSHPIHPRWAVKLSIELTQDVLVRLDRFLA
jgi:hypothetical protein